MWGLWAGLQLLPSAQLSVSGFRAAILPTVPLTNGVSQVVSPADPAGNPSDVLDPATPSSCLPAVSFPPLAAELAHPHQ